MALFWGGVAVGVLVTVCLGLLVARALTRRGDKDLNDWGIDPRTSGETEPERVRRALAERRAGLGSDLAGKVRDRS